MEDDSWIYRFSSDCLENITTRFLQSDSLVLVNHYNSEVKPQSVFTHQCFFLSLEGECDSWIYHFVFFQSVKQSYFSSFSQMDTSGVD
jgi:hypothetical protein